MKAPISSSSTKTLVVWAILFLATYAFFAAACVYLFYKSGGQTAHLQTEEGQQLLHGVRVMSTLYLGFGLILLALWRVAYHHPFYTREYLRWLRTTPWQRGMPLPNGSPYPGLIEIVLIALVGCYAFWVLPVMSAVWLLSAYGLFFTVLVIPPYLMHGKDMPGRHAFAVFMLVGLLFLCQETPWAVGVTAAAILVVGLWAMHASLLYVPRYGETSNDAMETQVNFTPVTLNGVEPEKLDHPLPPIQALGLSAILAYWAGILHYLVEPGHVAIAGPSLSIAFIAFFRWCFYVEKRRAPITLKQRLRMRILILPSYDKVFAAPLLAVLICVAVLSAGHWLLINPPLVTASSIFLAILVLSMVGPARQHWQMTSDHRVIVR